MIYYIVNICALFHQGVWEGDSPDDELGQMTCYIDHICVISHHCGLEDDSSTQKAKQKICNIDRTFSTSLRCDNVGAALAWQLRQMILCTGRNCELYHHKELDGAFLEKQCGQKIFRIEDICTISLQREFVSAGSEGKPQQMILCIDCIYELFHWYEWEGASSEK